MNEILFHSSDDGINHKLTFNFSENIKYKFTDLYKEELDNGNLLAADKYFDIINSHTDNFIVDRNYEHIDSSVIDVAVLFKHVFRNFKERQKYFKCRVTFADDMIVVVSKATDSGPFLRTPSKTEMLPIKHMIIKVHKLANSDMMDCVIEFSTYESVDKYQNFYMAIVFVKKLINDTIQAFSDL
jgi:hypothetical protein